MKTYIITLLFIFSITFAPQLFSTALTNDNVVIILDASGSMEWKMPDGTVKMDAAKAALLEVLNQVPETTRIGLLVFSARNLKDDWAYPLGARNDEKLIEAIKKPVPGYRTPLGQYMKLGADKLLEQRKKQQGYGTYRLLIITDGLADDQHLIDRYLPDILSRGIIIDVIGVDMKSQHTLATKVQSYRKADDPKSLAKAVKEVFAEVSVDNDSKSLEEVFRELDSIPNDLAIQIIKTLAETGNQPIGKTPMIKSPNRFKNTQKKSSSSKSSSKKTSDDKGGSDVVFYIIVIGIIMVASGKKKK
ncbi:VWA domain-containing protein [bacterium]|nr:VWA domain-containing protein [bacterium]